MTCQTFVLGCVISAWVGGGGTYLWLPWADRHRRARRKAQKAEEREIQALFESAPARTPLPMPLSVRHHVVLQSESDGGLADAIAAAVRSQSRARRP